MMTVGRHRIRNHMTLEYEFSGIRIYEGSLIPVDWTLQVNLVAPDQKGMSRDDVEYEAGITYQKLYFWLETNLPNVVMVDVGTAEDLHIANLSANIMMYCPGTPNDDTIIELLHAKLTTLSAGSLIVGEMKIKASDTSIAYTYDCPDGDYELPGATEDYFTEAKVRDETPWWGRDDGFCFEFIRPKETELTDAELFKGIVDPMTEFTRIIRDMTDKHIGIVQEPARIVQVERWKPRKV